MRLVILGSGSSVPDGRRAGAGFWVETGAERVLLDCGPGVLPSLARHVRDWTSVTHVILSHLHVDHVIELPALLFALRHALRDSPGRTSPLRITGPTGSTSMLLGMEESLSANLLDPGFQVTITEVAPPAVVDLAGEATVRLIHTPHTPESLAVRIDAGRTSVGYTGDSAPSGQLPRFFAGCDLLVCDCSLPEPRDGVMHMSTAQAADLATRAGVSHLVATHLFPEQDEGQVERILGSEFPGTVTLARDGLEMVL